MKAHYLLILLSCLLACCTNKKITKYPNGSIYEVAELNDKGQRHGKRISYFEDGKIDSEAMYTNDSLDGFYRDYYENGNKHIECYYKNGKIDIYEKSYYHTGQASALIEYKNGYMQGRAVFYFTNGAISAKAVCENGVYLYYTKYDSLGGGVIKKHHHIQIYILNKLSKHDSLKIKAKIYNFTNPEHKPIHSFFYKLTSDGGDGEYMTYNKADDSYYHTFKPRNDTGKFYIGVAFLLEGKFSNEADSIVSIKE